MIDVDILHLRVLLASAEGLRGRGCSAGHNYIGTEHILLGLLREGEGVAARVLETLGADPAKIRTQVRKYRRKRG
jgi:ATP-dependent Clp protease ATP-binding subunit ClpA